MEFKDYLQVLTRRKLAILLTVFLALVTATVVTFAMTPIYGASALLRVSPPIIGTVDYAEMVYAERVTNTHIKMLTSWPVMDAVATRLNVPRDGLEKRIKVEAIRDTELIKITVEDPDPKLAKGIAQAMTEMAMEQNQRPRGGRTAQDMLAEQLATMQRELGLARATLSATQPITSSQEAITAASNLKVMEETYGTLQREYEQARARDLIRANSVSIVEPAEATRTPIKPNQQQNIGLGALLGLLAGIGLAFLAESLDKSIRTAEDLERELKINVLGTVPRFRTKGETPEIVMGNPLAGPAVESYRLLRANLQASGKTCKTLLFTSAGSGEGKSTIVANLAVAAAQAKQQVAVIDTDFRRPSIHKIFGLSNYRGLSQTLLQEQSVGSLMKATEYQGLRVLTSGPVPPNPDVALDPRAVGALVSELTQLFDLILIDGPPALLVADTSLIAPLFDGVVVVARYGQTPWASLRRIVSLLGSVNANVIGTVLNGFEVDNHNHYYHEYYRAVSSGTGVR